MRIKLEGVKKRREQLIDQLKFGDEYEDSFDRQCSSQTTKIPIPRQINSNKWIWQSAVAILFVLSTIFMQQLSSPWAQSSVAFINDVVDRDYNWEGVIEALPFEYDLFNIQDGIIAPSVTPIDPGQYNDFAGSYPSGPEVLPVFGASPSESAIGSNDVGDTKLALPIEGLRVKKFTEEKPFIEFIALQNKDVQAVANSVVTKVGYNDKEELLIYTEGQGFTYVYGRVKDLMVKEGDTVVKGQKLATVSSTEDVELLLFQIIKDGKAIDPESMLP